MNELIKVINGEVTLDSRVIAEHFDKRHDNVLKDIKDEMDKLESGGLDGALIFEVSSYTSEQNKNLLSYTMSEEGALQLAARYDAVARRKLIIKIKELKEQDKNPSCIEDLIILQAQSLKNMREDVKTLKIATEEAKGFIKNIKETIQDKPNEEWRKWINMSLNKIVRESEQSYQDTRNNSYLQIESEGRCRLAERVRKAKKRLEDVGATKTDINAYCKLSAIENDARLKVIYTGIVEKLVIKYVA